MPEFKRKEFPHQRRPESREAFDREGAWRKAKEALAKKEISLEEFRGLYDAAMIDRDTAYVRQRESEIARAQSREQESSKQLADIFEAIVYEQVEEGHWLGSDASTIRSSRFDDLKNGVDSVVRFRRGGEGDAYMGLAIDVTFGSDIQKKMEHVLEEIERGDLAEVKYVSAGGDEKGANAEFTGRMHVPRVVVGFNGPLVEELAGLWMDKTRTRELASHPAQMLLIEEIRQQLEVLAAYAEKKEKKQIAAVYRRNLEVLSRSVAGKNAPQTSGRQNTPQIPERLLKDRVYTWIKNYMEDLNAGNHA